MKGISLDGGASVSLISSSGNKTLSLNVEKGGASSLEGGFTSTFNKDVLNIKSQPIYPTKFPIQM